MYVVLKMLTVTVRPWMLLIAPWMRAICADGGPGGTETRTDPSFMCVTLNPSRLRAASAAPVSARIGISLPLVLRILFWNCCRSDTAALVSALMSVVLDDGSCAYAAVSCRICGSVNPAAAIVRFNAAMFCSSTALPAATLPFCSATDWACVIAALAASRNADLTARPFSLVTSSEWPLSLTASVSDCSDDWNAISSCAAPMLTPFSAFSASVNFSASVR